MSSPDDRDPRHDDLVGLLGWPTSHSLSPPMQNAGFAALGLDWAYVPLPTPPESLADAVRGLQALGFAGANVTIPHKQAVIPLCDELDEVARARGLGQHARLRRTGASSALDGRRCGDGPDRGGRAARARARRRRQLEGCRGRARARRRRGDRREPAEPGWPPSAEGFDILVNATPVKEELIVAPHAGMQVVDLAYLPDGRDTALIAAARAAGCDLVVDGLDVLLFQGAAVVRALDGAAGAARRDAGRPARRLTPRQG